MAKTPFVLTVGEREAESGAVSVRPYFDTATDTIKGVLPVAASCTIGSAANPHTSDSVDACSVIVDGPSSVGVAVVTNA